MDSMEKELALAYREAEAEVKGQEDNMTSLSKKLNQAQKERDKATANLERAEGEANNNSLTTVTAIEKARKNVQYAKYAVEDHAQAVNNLEDAIQNAKTSLKEVAGELHRRKVTILSSLIRIKAEEIRTVAGAMFEDYVALYILSRGHVPFSSREVPDDLLFITAPGIDTQKIERKIFQKFLNNL